LSKELSFSGASFRAGTPAHADYWGINWEQYPTMRQVHRGGTASAQA